MLNFDIIWKFAVIGFFICIVLQINQLEKTIKECFLVPDIPLPEYENVE
jgi:hypothetical protein